MGQVKGRMHREYVFRDMLKSKEAKMGQKQLTQFLTFIQEIEFLIYTSSWFPEESTVSLQRWEEVGVRTNEYYITHSPGKRSP